MKDFIVDVRDLILVSVDKRIKDYVKQAEGFLVGEEIIPRGKIKELAILDEGKTQFILISEFEELKIREVKHFVPLNSVGEYAFCCPEISVIPSPTATILLTQEEISFGVDFSRLKQKNQDFIYGQFREYMKQRKKSKINEKKYKALQKSRRNYLNFKKLIESKQNERQGDRNG